MKTKNLLMALLVFNFVLCFKLNGQNLSKQELYSITQVPPDAAALGKYGEYPIGYYTGVPSINIPFYEINSGRIKVPIGLSYHAGGIKVEEIASSVGLGWSLNAGGVITRSVKGLPDEKETGEGNFINPLLTVKQFLNTQGSGDFAKRMKKVLAQKIDGEPDVFYFNFGNVSGKFMYHQDDKKFYSIPYSKLKIEFYDQESQSSFTITDENGIEYFFEDKEYSNRESEGTPATVTVITSWYLTSIYDPVSKNKVYFTYADNTTSYTTMSIESHYMPLTAYNEGDYSPSSKQQSSLQLKKLVSINSKTVSVFFDYSVARCDLPGNYALTNVDVRNNDHEQLKELRLNYDYFNADGFYDADCDSEIGSTFRRLKLLGVTESPYSENGGLKHLFEYNVMPLPSRLSKSQDHWGYYNGVSNLHLYPPYTITVNGYPTNLAGGNRDIQPLYAKAGILEKITYPTGGSTSFEFESNTAISSQTELPSPTTSGEIRFSGGGESRYIEQPFNIFSESCSQNNNRPGAYVTLDVKGLDIGLINLFGFPGISAQVRLVNMETMEDDVLFQKGGDKDIGNVSYMPRTYYLPNGDYKFIVDFSHNPFPETYMEAKVSLTWQQCIPKTDMGDVNRYVGGLRLKKLTNLSAVGALPIIKTFSYGQINNPNFTSGQTHFYPQYFSTMLFDPSFELDQYWNGSGPQTYLKRTSTSNYPLVSEHGKSVGYSNVTEYNGLDDSNGFTQYLYTNYSEYDDEIGGVDYTKIPVSKQWLRGLELGKKIFKKANGSNQLVSETINEYATDLLGSNRKVFKGIVGKFIWSFSGQELELPGEDMTVIGVVNPGWGVFPTYSDFVYLKKAKERIYQGVNYVETVKEFTYNTKNLMASKVEVINSDSTKTTVTTKYALDYTLNNPSHPTARGIKHLQDLNYINTPIEVFKERKDGASSRKLLGANFYSYLPDEPLVDTVFSMQTPSSSISNYEGIAINNNTVLRHPNYEPGVIVTKYDPYNNSIQQQQKHNGIPISYIWDYDKVYPVAEVKGAVVSDIAYTSFEADGTGSWNYSGIPVVDERSVTGSKKYNLNPSASITKNGLNSSKTYVLSYWAKGVGGENISGVTAAAIKSYNGWTNYVREVSGVNFIMLSGSVELDELRLYPKESEMTSYTFDLGIGMTSQTDAKGSTNYYEYDAFQRLKNIKDQNGNIVKAYDYHFKP